jgi:hypothetical protein
MAEQEKSVQKGKNQEVTTLRGVRRLAKSGKVSDWAGPKVRTRGGCMVTARIRNGQVEVMEQGEGWVEYPEEGKNIDPDWSPTPAR